MKTDTFRGKDFLTLLDWSKEEVETILDMALDLKEKDLEMIGDQQKIRMLEHEKADIVGMRTVKNPVVSSRPVKPRKKKILASAAVASLVLGGFLAFFMEWAGRARRRTS